MSKIKGDRIKEELKHLAGKFLLLENSGKSLLTVTDILMSKDGKSAIVLFTAFPNEYEKTALEFLKRKRSDFKQFIRDNSVIGRIPHIDFEIDFGEKNRQRIDEISNQD
jgi:ribosome-binding factor A